MILAQESEKVYKKQTLAEISKGFSEGKKTVFKTYGVFGTQKGVFGLKAREKTRTLGLLAPLVLYLRNFLCSY